VTPMTSWSVAGELAGCISRFGSALAAMLRLPDPPRFARESTKLLRTTNLMRAQQLLP